MTQKEGEKIKEAIRLISSENGYEDGMDILKALLNPSYRNPLKGLPEVDIRHIKTCEPSEFGVNFLKNTAVAAHGAETREGEG